MTNNISAAWQREPGVRVSGSRPLDASKVQAPGVIERPEGGLRLFYTGVGPGRPYPACQGYILSAVSDDGLHFQTEPGIRLAPDPSVTHISLRVLAPSLVRLDDGRWRMYVEARGPSSRGPVITSAISENQVDWKHEPGIRLATADGLGGPRILHLADGRFRLLACADDYGPGGRSGLEKSGKHIISALSEDGLEFDPEPGERIRSDEVGGGVDGITAGQLLPPSGNSSVWTMIFSAWRPPPAGHVVPTHPSEPSASGTPSEVVDFAAASIAADISGFRSRIYQATSSDATTFGRPSVIVEGGGYDSDDVDGVHAEDMSVISLGDGKHRMYYASCDATGCWQIASAVSGS